MSDASNRNIFNELNFDDPSGLVPTLYNQGFMTTQTDAISNEFIAFSSKRKGWCLEVGAAYGVATLEAAKSGANIIANDLHQEHLDILMHRCPIEFKSRIRLLSGEFPEKPQIRKGSLAAILICRVLHLMNGDKFKKSLKRIYELLEPNGKVFVVTDSPFMGWWPSFPGELESRITRGDRWPGFFTPASEFCANPKVKMHLPESLHVFTKETLSREFEMENFKIEKIKYLDRKKQYPSGNLLDGRESVGLIARK